MARMYSTVRIVSAEIPCAVRYSSIDERRYVPLIRNSNGIGFSVSKRALTRVERAYRRRSFRPFSQCSYSNSGSSSLVFTRMGPVLSGRETSACRVVNCNFTCICVTLAGS